jgi:hypothetical protein
MVYRMYVDNKPGWNHFCNHVIEVYKSDRYRNKSIDYAMNDELGKHGAINVIGTKYIEFETEEDAVIFRLRWI